MAVDKPTVNVIYAYSQEIGRSMRAEVRRATADCQTLVSICQPGVERYLFRKINRAYPKKG